MSRLPLVDPATATGRNKEIFDGVFKSKRFNLFKALANSPIGLDLYLGAASTVAKGSLSAADREVIELVTAASNGCEYCQAAHTILGEHAGLTTAQTVAARHGNIPDHPRLNALARFATAAIEKRGSISDEDFAAFRAGGFSDAQLIEVIGNIALATFTNYFNNANQTPVDFPTPPKA